MRVSDECLLCSACVPYCPMGAISMEYSGVINQDECLDCGVCQRAGVCPIDGLYQPNEPWPRSLRAAFSNPLSIHPQTRIPGRGTEEMKTNEVTGRYRRGYAGIAIELGRPGTGTRFLDVQKVAQAIARLGDIEFEPKNPVTFLMVDKTMGTLNPEVLAEKVLSAIVEFTVPLSRVPEVLGALRLVANEVDTVFSVDLISRVEPDGRVPTEALMTSLSIPISINGKTNVGLGRPLAQEA